MKHLLTIMLVCGFGIGMADAAVRDASSLARNAVQTPAATTSRATASDIVSRATPSSDTAPNSSSRAGAVVRTRGNQTTTRQQIPALTSRATGRTTARAATTARPALSRAATSGIARTRIDNAGRGAQTVSRAVTRDTSHSGITKSRAATTTVVSETFGGGYYSCRDAYFTCMDQFCATQNDAYRRCVCSSRLEEIKTKERALGQTATQLQDFKDLNIEVIPKTAAEVNAMLTASEGELIASNARDNSSSAKALDGISSVLAGTKTKALSTAGQLDIAGNIDAIWTTTDLASGASIANLTGEALYNAVHAQCSELVFDSCDSTATLNMVVSAYGMYIENDCTALANSLGQKKNQANGTIRQTEREMNLARLENYNAHNSSSINDCIANVRADLTAATACGPDYVHCLDVTGRYLNRDTGAPIYTAEFYQLDGLISLDGDILTNRENRLVVAELNGMRMYAQRSLDSCRDLADEVWDEFMRQAITEIYQGQQEKIRQVKNECLDVVSTCYDEQAGSLKDFSNVDEQMLLGSRLELAEEMCQQKLAACSNLYGGGADGMQELLAAMHNITSQKIAKECRAALQDFAKDMCAVPSNDSLHTYPYACRVYAPGEQQYGAILACNLITQSITGTANSDTNIEFGVYTCKATKKYHSCNPGYVMDEDANCISCSENPEMCQCPASYTGSLYQKMVRYALQVCVRPSESTNPIPTHILADVNMVMDTIRSDMSKALSVECERLGGFWVSAVWTEKPASSTEVGTNASGHKLWTRFYTETGASTQWGYCSDPDTVWQMDKEATTIP